MRTRTSDGVSIREILIWPRACFKIPWESCFRGKGWMARRDEGGYPQRSLTEEQRSQPAFSAKTLRAAGLLPVAFVGSVLTARCGDARTSPPWPQSKSLAAAPFPIFSQALKRYSHSIVPGGLLVMSNTQRFTPLTSLMIRDAKIGRAHV